MIFNKIRKRDNNFSIDDFIFENNVLSFIYYKKLFMVINNFFVKCFTFTIVNGKEKEEEEERNVNGSINLSSAALIFRKNLERQTMSLIETCKTFETILS